MRAFGRTALPACKINTVVDWNSASWWSCQIEEKDAEIHCFMYNIDSAARIHGAFSSCKTGSGKDYMGTGTL